MEQCGAYYYIFVGAARDGAPLKSQMSAYTHPSLTQSIMSGCCCSSRRRRRHHRPAGSKATAKTGLLGQPVRRILRHNRELQKTHTPCTHTHIVLPVIVRAE